MFVFISYLSDMDVMDLYYTIPLGMSTIILKIFESCAKHRKMI